MGWWCFLGVWSPVRPVLSPTSQITSKLNCPAHTDWPPASSSPPLCWKAKSLVQGSRSYRQSWKCETRAKCHVFTSVKIWFNQRGHILWWLLHSYLSWVALIDWMGRVRQALVPSALSIHATDHSSNYFKSLQTKIHNKISLLCRRQWKWNWMQVKAKFSRKDNTKA